MRVTSIIWNAIFVIVSLYTPIISHATQIFTLQIDPSTSWIQDRSWVETLPNSAEAIYHEGKRFSLSGSANVILGRDYPSSIEIEVLNVSPGNLPSGHEVIPDITSQTLVDNIFPNNSFLLSGGAICACSTLVDVFAPSVFGIFDETFLSVDYFENVMQILPANVTWIGDAPFSSAQNQYSFHIEASAIPLSPTFILMLSGLGLMGLSKIYTTKARNT